MVETISGWGYNLRMGKIRKLYFFDKKKTQEMISFLNNSENDNYFSRILFNPFLFLHYFLPLRFKYLPESYVLKEGKLVKGLITVAPTRCRYKKMEIQKLLFEENSYVDAAELVQFVVSKYKAMGALSILVKVDDYLPELLMMLVSKCGFSQISYEKLWRINNFPTAEFDKKEFRAFRNSDAQALTNIYNDSLLPHFRPLLAREVKEFKETLFGGLSCYSEYKYVIEDKRSRNLIGAITITTYDNENFVIDINQSAWVDLDVNSIINYAVYQIKKRKKRFGIFIRSKRYMNFGEKYEEIFKENGFECIQNQIVLTNSSARLLKEPMESTKYTVLSDFLPTKPLSTQL